MTVAAELFHANGYESTSTRELSERLGINKASLYYHVNSKEDLLHTICVQALESLEADVARAIEAGVPEGALERAVRAHLVNTLTNVVQHGVMLRDLRHLSGDRLAATLKQREQYELVLKSLIVDAQQHGRLRTDLPARKLVLALLNLLNWAVVWYRPNGEMTVDEIADLLLDIYLNGSIAR